MNEVGELAVLFDFVARRVERAELFRRLPGGWVQGERGGRSWFVPPDHIREYAPRVYARPISVGGVRGQARLHLVEGDVRLRSISIAMEPLAIDAQGEGASAIAGVLNAVASTCIHAMAERRDPAFVANGSLHPHDDGVQAVIDIEAVDSPPEEPPSMEEFFVFYD